MKRRNGALCSAHERCPRSCRVASSMCCCLSSPMPAPAPRLPLPSERGFAEVREYGQLELRAGVACRSLLRCISNHLHGTDTMHAGR